ncbi:MAG: LicD family protein [Lachnospiraceae bacterium]|nr:LicD family protein [Lachnospiraceae bacterium]
MIFDEGFFKGEERDGFYIRPMIKRAWAAQLEVLDVISDICDMHGIRWFADSGTLLGAVRHKGFIPWDDDVDIAMLRRDYERFRIYARDELPEGWYIRNDRDSDNISGAVPCVVNSETVRIDEEFLQRFHGCPYNVGVDIFILDVFPEDTEEWELYRILTGNAYDIEEHTPKRILFDECDAELRERVEKLEETSGVRLDRTRPLKPQLNRLADQLAAMYYDSDSPDVGIASFHLNKSIRIPGSCYEETKYLQFEHVMLPAPVDYDTVLRLSYGDDYMTPLKIYDFHSYPFFGEAENKLRRWYADNGKAFPEEFE